MSREPANLGDVIGRITRDLGVMDTTMLTGVERVCREVLGEGFVNDTSLRKLSVTLLVFEVSNEEAVYLEVRRSQLLQSLREIGYEGDIVISRARRW